MRQKEIITGVVAQILFAVFGITLILSGTSLYLGFMDFVTLEFFTYFAFFYAAWLFLPSAFKISDTFRSHPGGIIAMIFGISSALTSMLLFAWAPYAISYAPGYTYHYISEYLFYPTTFGVLLSFVSDFFLGLMLFMLGWFFLAQNKRISPRWLWFATGIVYVVTGLLGVVIIFSFITYPLMVLAALMGSLCFIIGKPSDYVERSTRRITRIALR